MILSCSSRGWWLTLALTITATGLTACGGEEDGGDGTAVPNARTASPTPRPPRDPSPS